MFNALGFGVGASILAGAFAVVGFVSMVVLWFWGEKIRAKSRYCQSAEST